jgi:hypothetical protein
MITLKAKKATPCRKLELIPSPGSSRSFCRHDRRVRFQKPDGGVPRVRIPAGLSPTPVNARPRTCNREGRFDAGKSAEMLPRFRGERGERAVQRGGERRLALVEHAAVDGEKARAHVARPVADARRGRAEPVAEGAQCRARGVGWSMARSVQPFTWPSPAESGRSRARAGGTARRNMRSKAAFSPLVTLSTWHRAAAGRDSARSAAPRYSAPDIRIMRRRTPGGAVSNAVSATRAPSEWATMWTGSRAARGGWPIIRPRLRPASKARAATRGRAPVAGQPKPMPSPVPGRSRCRWRGQLTAFQQSLAGGERQDMAVRVMIGAEGTEAVAMDHDRDRRARRQVVQRFVERLVARGHMPLRTCRRIHTEKRHPARPLSS